MKASVLGASILLVVGAFFSKFLGFFREIVFVHQFGTGAISDAFLLTNNIPNILFSAFAVAINMNFIPIYMGIDDNFEKNRFTSNLFNIGLLFTLSGFVLINLFPRQVLLIFVSSLSDETLHYAIIMLCIVSASIVPIILQRFFQAYSQANGYFFSTAALGCITNIVLIITYLVARDETFYILSLGVVFAQFAAMIMMYCNARKAGFRYSWGVDFKDPLAKTMVLLTIPLMVGKFAEDASLLVDQNLAAGIGTGVISSLSYASLLARSISSMVMNSVITAAFPTFSKLAAEGQGEMFLSSFRKYLALMCYVLCPISVFMFFFADDIVLFVLTRGALKASAAKMIWEATACYAVGLLPLGIQNYMVRGFYAFRDTKTPTYIVIFSLLCNIGLSIWSAPFWGHIGITSATSISYFIAAVLLVLVFVRKYKMSVFQGLMADLTGCVFFAALTCASVYYLIRIVFVTDWVMARVFLESVLFFSLYAILLFATHKDMYRQMISYIKKRS